MDKKFKEFNELLKNDPHLQKQLQKAKNEEDFVRIYCQLAKQNGFEISNKEIREFLMKVKKNESIKRDLNEEEIKKLAGGCYGGSTRYCD